MLLRTIVEVSHETISEDCGDRHRHIHEVLRRLGEGNVVANSCARRSGSERQSQEDRGETKWVENEGT